MGHRTFLAGIDPLHNGKPYAGAIDRFVSWFVFWMILAMPLMHVATEVASLRRTPATLPWSRSSV